MVLTPACRLKKKFALILVGILCILFTINSFQKKQQEDDVLHFNPYETAHKTSNNFHVLRDTFNQSVPNISHIRYHQNSAKACSINSPTLLIVVHSAPAHFLHRKAIRNTWGSSGRNIPIRTAFVVGRSHQPLVWQRLVREASQSGDIVLSDMLDTYHNLTLKHLVGIHWALKNCPNVFYILKTDDDAFINIRLLANVLLQNFPVNTLACRIVPSGSAPRRSGKWKVNKDEYPLDTYPEYCSGLAYISRTKTFSKMYEAATSGKVPCLWIDDVFMTGFSATFAGIERMDLSVWYARTDEQVIQWMTNHSISHTLPWMVAEMTPRYWPLEAISIWNKIEMTEKLLQQH